MDMPTTEVQTQNSQEAGATKTKEPRTAAKAAPAEKQSSQTLDKFALRRAAVKKQKRKAHRHTIAASHRNG